MRNLRLKTATILGAGIVFLGGAVTPVAAQEGLSDGLIRAFYNESVAVGKRSAKETIDFLRRHTADDAVISFNMVSKEVGAEKPQIMNFTKPEMMAFMQENFALSDNAVEGGLVSVDIAPDMRSAKITDKNIYTVKTNIPSPAGGFKYVTKQTVICIGEIVLTAENIIQTKQQACNGETIVVEGANSMRKLQESIIKSIQ